MKRLQEIKRAVPGLAAVLTASCLWSLFLSGDTGAALAASTSPVPINESSFPDPVFRSVISGAEYDRDANGVLDEEEIAQTINIYCEGMGITSLQGVGYFTALQGLWCKDNKITSLDVSGNRELHGLWCSGNPITTLDLSGNPELEWVYCYDCALTRLDVSANPGMAFIECNTNPLTVLDVTHNPELEHLTCGSCALSVLDLSNNPKLAHLDAFRNHLTTLDVSHNPKLKRLDIWDNPGLGSIDISHNPGLQYYNCANNDAVSIDVSHNPELQKLICSYNDIGSLDVSHNPKLFYLDCACNQIRSLDLSANPELHFLQAFTNNFTTLDIGNNPFLIKTYNEGVKRDESAVCRGHSWTIDYGGDTSTGGDNLYFLCFDDAVTLLSTAPETPAAESASETRPVSGDELTRETAAWMLYTLAGSPNATASTSRFKDVASGAWYEPAILWGEKNAVCSGYPDVSSDSFGVGRALTRQDMALMLMRYSEVMDYKRAIDFGRADDFKDYYDIDQYAWEAVTWAITWHLMDGKGEAGAPKEELRIDPHGSVTLAEFQDMYNRMMEVNGLVARSSFPVPDTSATAASSGTSSVTDGISASDGSGADEALPAGNDAASEGAGSDQGIPADGNGAGSASPDGAVGEPAAADDEVRNGESMTDDPGAPAGTADAGSGAAAASEAGAGQILLLVIPVLCIAAAGFFVIRRKRKRD